SASLAVDPACSDAMAANAARIAVVRAMRFKNVPPSRSTSSSMVSRRFSVSTSCSSGIGAFCFSLWESPSLLQVRLDQHRSRGLERMAERVVELFGAAGGARLDAEAFGQLGEIELRPVQAGERQARRAGRRAGALQFPAQDRVGAVLAKHRRHILFLPRHRPQGLDGVEGRAVAFEADDALVRLRGCRPYGTG